MTWYFQHASNFFIFAMGPQHFQLVALPFGLLSALQVFTNVLASLVAILHSQGIPIGEYLDNLLLWEQLEQVLTTNAAQTFQTLQRFSWVLKFQKSGLKPTHYLKYLSLNLDADQGRGFLTQEKLQTLLSKTQTVQFRSQTNSLLLHQNTGADGSLL